MAVTEGTDAQAEVMVRLEENGKEVTGRGADTLDEVTSRYRFRPWHGCILSVLWQRSYHR